MAKYTKRRDKRGYEWKSAYREKEALLLARGYLEVHNRHFSFENINELRQFVQIALSQEVAELGLAGIILGSLR